MVKDFGNGAYVWVKDVETRHGKTRAVALYNSSDEELTIAADYAELDLAGAVKVRDLYERKDVEMGTEGVCAVVPAHGTRIYRLEAEKRLERKVYEAETAYLATYQELSNPNAVGSAYYEHDANCFGGAKVRNLGKKPSNDLRWLDVYSEQGGEYELTVYIAPTEEAIQHKDWVTNPGGYQFFLTVNDGVGARMQIDKDQTSATVKVTLKPGSNVVRLYDDRFLMPDIDAMLVNKL